MILINLLPQEYRQKRRTPIKFMAATAAAVAVNASLLAFWAWTAFGVAAQVRAELTVLQDTRSGLEPQVAYHKELQAESQLFDSREKTLRDVTSKRVSWTQQVDHLVHLINDGGGGEQEYLVWLDDLTGELKENARAKSYGKFKGSGHSGSSSFAHVANFLEDIENSEFRRTFFKPYPPSGTQQKKDEELIPSEIWDFPLEMDLRSPEDRAVVGADDGLSEDQGEER